MCLGVPGKVLSVQDGDLRTGTVEFGGVTKQVCLAYVPEADVGDYVIVHVGFAISKLDEQQALQAWTFLEQLGDLTELAGEPAP